MHWRISSWSQSRESMPALAATEIYVQNMARGSAGACALFASERLVRLLGIHVCAMHIYPLQIKHTRGLTIMSVMRSLGISHTKDTPVGDAMLR